MQRALQLLAKLMVPTSLILALSCGEDLQIEPRTEREYPTTIAPLPPDSLETLRREFASANPRICFKLNEYGFTSGILCSYGNRGIGPDTDIDRLVEIAKDTIHRNGRFTGVTDPSQLLLRKASPVLVDVRVDFQPQEYQGFLVERTYLAVRMDSVGVLSMSGNHYPDIYIPRPMVSSRRAQRSILGMVLRWVDWQGPNTHIVTSDDLCQEPVRVVLPNESDAGIELRVAWKIPVGCEHPRWHVYIDTVKGDSLYVRDNWVF